MLTLQVIPFLGQSPVWISEKSEIYTIPIPLYYLQISTEVFQIFQGKKNLEDFFKNVDILKDLQCGAWIESRL